MTIAKCILTVVFLFLLIIARAQYRSNIHYTTFDGLPSQVVYSVLQDSKGFIWMGTQNGLCRFDGKNFKNYTTDDGLPDNEVLSVAEDKTGRIWLSLFNGGTCYFKDEVFYSSKNDSSLAKLAILSDYVSYFFPANEEGFFIYGGKSTYYLNYKLEIKERYKDVYFRPCISRGQCASFTREAISFYKNGKMVSVASDKSPFPKEKFISARSRFVDSQFYTSLEKEPKLYIAVLDRNFSARLSISKPFPYRVNNIYKLGSFYYILTNNQVMLRCRDTDLFFSDYEIFMTGSYFTSIIRDNEGGLWVATLADGIFYLPSENASTISVYSGLEDKSIYSIFDYRDKAHFTDADGNIYTTNPVQKIISLSANKKICRVLRSTMVDNTLLTATDEGAFAVDMHDPHSVKKLMSQSKDICFYHNEIYVGGGFGILRHRYNSSFQFIDTIVKGRRTTCLHIDRAGQLWFGELNGLMQRKPSGGIIQYGNIFPALKSRITGITESADGILWVTTQVYGLIGLRNDSILFRLSKAEGLSSSNLKSIFTNSNRLYIAGDKGVNIVTYDIKQRNCSIRHIDKFDGLADNDVNSVYEKNDTLYAGTSHGFSIVPLKNNLQQVAPKVYITNFSVNGKDLSVSTVAELPYYKNNISLSFIGLSYRSGNNILYRYKLARNEPWKYTRNINLTFPELGSGEYHVLIDAQTSYGLWSEHPASLNFIIQKPVWKQSWFWFSTVMATVLCILLIWHRNTGKVKRNLQLRNSMLKSEIKALRAQMNPHFIFNSLNSIQHFIFSNRKEEANEYLVQFSKLIRMILDHSQNSFITMAEEIAFLKLYLELEQLRLNNKFDFDFVYNNCTELSECIIPSMLLQPFAENSVLHGIAPREGKALLTISFTKNDTGLVCMIEDDGVGISETAIGSKAKSGHRSFGISSLRERITTINQLYSAGISFEIINRAKVAPYTSGTIVKIKINTITDIA